MKILYVLEQVILWTILLPVFAFCVRPKRLAEKNQRACPERSRRELRGQLVPIITCLLLLELLSLSKPAQAQVGIGTTTPDASAILDMVSTSQGVLVSKMTAVQRDAIITPARGLLVFVNDDSTFYYNQGLPATPDWVRLLSSSSGTGGWTVTGNSGTSSGTNFLGTTDNVSLRIKTNNLERMIVDSTGNVGIGTSTANGLLHLQKADASTTLIVENTNSTGLRYPTVVVKNYRGSPNFDSYPYFSLINARGNITAPAALQNNDPLGSLQFWGASSASTVARGAQIQAVALESFTAATAATGLAFYTCPSGDFDATNYERVRIDQNGNVGIGTTTPAAQLDVKGRTNTNTTFGFAVRNSDNIYSLVVRDDGNIGIGKTAPGSKLDIKGGGGLNVDLRSNGRIRTGDAFNQGGVWLDAAENLFIGQTLTATTLGLWTNGAFRLSVTNTGDIGIGTTTPTQRLTVYNGTTTGTYTTTGWVHSSDARLKTNVTPIGNSLDKVMELNGVYFNWINMADSNKQMGFIAQEVEKVIPEVVVKDSDGKYGMAYGNLTAVLVNAIKEQQEQIEELKTENDALKADLSSEIQRMQEENATIKAELSEIKSFIGISTEK